MEFEHTTIVVTGTDCMGRCKFNYHTIMTTTAPWKVMLCCYRNQSSRVQSDKESKAQQQQEAQQLIQER